MVQNVLVLDKAERRCKRPADQCKLRGEACAQFSPSAARALSERDKAGLAKMVPAVGT